MPATRGDEEPRAASDPSNYDRRQRVDQRPSRPQTTEKGTEEGALRIPSPFTHQRLLTFLLPHSRVARVGERAALARAETGKVELIAAEVLGHSPGLSATNSKSTAATRLT